MDITQYYTHQKRPYQAVCTQLTADNFEQVISIVQAQGEEAVTFGECVLVRFSKYQPGREQIIALKQGWWVVVGENGVMKCYDNETFNVKYEEVQ